MTEISKIMACTFEVEYKEKVPISQRNRNFMGWVMGLDPTVSRATIWRFNQLSYIHHILFLLKTQTKEWHARRDSNP